MGDAGPRSVIPDCTDAAEVGLMIGAASPSLRLLHEALEIKT